MVVELFTPLSKLIRVESGCGGEGMEGGGVATTTLLKAKILMFAEAL